MEFDPINTFGGKANPNQSTRFGNSVSGNSTGDSSGSFFSDVGNLLGYGGDGSDKSKDTAEDSLLSRVGNLINGGNDNKDSDQKFQEILNIAKEGTQVVENLRQNNGGASLSEIVKSVKGIAKDEAKHDRNFRDYMKGMGSMSSTLGGIGTAVGSVVPGIGNAAVGAVGAIVGAVAGLVKNFIQDIGGMSDYEKSKKVEKKLSNELQKAGIKLPDGMPKESLMAGYNHDQEQKAKEAAKLIGVANEYGTPAQNYISFKLKKNNKDGQPINQGQPSDWVKEYLEIRAQFELSIERMHESLTRITEKPEGSKERAKNAYDQLVKLHKEHPHPNYKKAADTLLKKVKAAYKKQTSRMFGMTPDTQKKYLLYGGAAFVLIAVVVVIIIITQREE